MRSLTSQMTFRAGIGCIVLAAMTSVGCGMGTDAQASQSALLTSGLPHCDGSLLHTRITLGNTALLPGKLIVYVDGVMACVDDAARVDQLVGQIEGHAREALRAATPPTAAQAEVAPGSRPR
jgi:hypothetical protein